MAENGNPTRKDAGVPPMAVTALQLVITFDQVTGALNVTGPIQNAVICFGMMEAAKDVIRKYIDANQGKILHPGTGLPTIAS
jgi:hypothetical protein